MDEKNHLEAGPAVDVGSPTKEAPVRNFEKTHDAALDFIRANENGVRSDLHQDPVYAKRLRRKVDGLVMPFLLLCYSMNFLDKVLLNYSAVMGIRVDLNLQGNDFTNASSAFFIAVLVASFPNIYLLQRLPVAKWLGFCLTAWGLCTACHAALRNYGGLLALRIFCGIFEAAIPSCLLLISGQYYTRQEQAVRYSYWFSGMGLAQILGGLFSFAFQHVKAAPGSVTSGWRMMFLALGLFTLLLGISIFFLVPDTPMQAWFFTVEERINLLEHVRGNQLGIDNKRFMPRQLLEGILDPQAWLMFLIIVLQGIGGGTITTYSATLLTTFGFNPMQAALLNMPSGAVNIIATFFCGIMARYFGFRWVWTSFLSLLGVVGACLLSFAPMSNRAALLAGIYLTNALVGATPVDWQWVMANTAGHTKRTYVAAGLNAAFAIGNIIGPQTFQAKDYPQYKPAKESLVACWSASVLLTFLLAAYYLYCNKRRAAQGHTVLEDDVSETKAFAGLTDKQNKDFKYCY